MLEDYLRDSCFGPRLTGVMKFHNIYKDAIYSAKGSAFNHQSWEGGYVEHLYQCFQLAEFYYRLKYEFGGIPFSKQSVYTVLYFHDIEKIFKHNKPSVLIDKDMWLYGILHENFGISFSKEEKNALKYIHGEGYEYSKTEKKMQPLAAFCHIVDVTSARIYFNQKFLDEPFQTI